MDGEWGWALLCPVTNNAHPRDLDQRMRVMGQRNLGS
jgi:hypothetical protein